MKETIFRKVLDFQNGLSHKHLPVSFSSTFLWLLPKIEQKRIYLNDKIAWCKKSRVVKDLSNSGSFFLFSVLKHFFILSTRKFHVFLKIFLTKKIIILERLVCEDKPSQKFHKCYSWRTCNDVLTTLVNLCDERVSVCQGCSGPVKNNGLPFPPSYDLVPVTKMRREYFKDGKKQISGPSNV